MSIMSQVTILDDKTLGRDGKRTMIASKIRRITSRAGNVKAEFTLTVGGNELKTSCPLVINFLNEAGAVVASKTKSILITESSSTTTFSYIMSDIASVTKVQAFIQITEISEEETTFVLDLTTSTTNPLEVDATVPYSATVTPAKTAEAEAAEDIMFTIQLLDGNGEALEAKNLVEICVLDADGTPKATVGNLTIVSGNTYEVVTAKTKVKCLTEADGSMTVLLNDTEDTKSLMVVLADGRTFTSVDITWAAAA